MSVNEFEHDSSLVEEQSEPPAPTPDVTPDIDNSEPVALPDATIDWPTLEERFTEEMARREQEEAKIGQDWQRLMAFYELWLRVPAEREKSRAAQRLRTRIAFVQAEERELEAKQQHHKKVVQAFQSALNLLHDT